MKLNILLLLTVMLAGCRSHEPRTSKPGATSEDVLRVHRIELTDDHGNVRAIVGFQKNALQPEVTLLDEQSKPSATMTLDNRGQATIFFNDPNGPKGQSIDGRVSLGYLWGSDCCYKPGEYDPLASWGIKVLGKDKDGHLSHKNQILADSNEKDLSRFVAPPKVEAIDAYRR